MHAAAPSMRLRSFLRRNQAPRVKFSSTSTGERAVLKGRRVPPLQGDAGSTALEVPVAGGKPPPVPSAVFDGAAAPGKRTRRGEASAKVPVGQGPSASLPGPGAPPAAAAAAPPSAASVGGAPAAASGGGSPSAGGGCAPAASGGGGPAAASSGGGSPAPCGRQLCGSQAGRPCLDRRGGAPPSAGCPRALSAVLVPPARQARGHVPHIPRSGMCGPAERRGRGEASGRTGGEGPCGPGGDVVEFLLRVGVGLRCCPVSYSDTCEPRLHMHIEE